MRIMTKLVYSWDLSYIFVKKYIRRKLSSLSSYSMYFVLAVFGEVIAGHDVVLLPSQIQPEGAANKGLASSHWKSLFRAVPSPNLHANPG